VAARSGRYFRLISYLARYTLSRELAFRSNFLVKVSVEVLWLAILIAFFKTIFARTHSLAGWSEPDYFFFIGCYFALNGLIETLFFENCNEFAELVRTGDLDFLLLRPIDEQFLVSLRKIDWGTAPNVLMGAALMAVALVQKGWGFDLMRVVTFLITFCCGIAIGYSFMLILTTLSVWLVRNQSLMEMWWLFSSLARYPREIYQGRWAEPLGRFFTYAVPILVVSNVPANAMVRLLDPGMIAWTIVAAIVSLYLSRRFFQHALRSYRSASS
jgi:viologen exporter family transport system permease protein